MRCTVADPYGDQREAVLCGLRGETGVTGWGEASPLPGYSPDDLERAEAWLRRPDELGASGDVPSAPPSAGYALGTARLDLAARGRGVPLRDLLTGDRAASPPARIPVAAVVPLAGVARAGGPPASPEPEVVLERVATLAAAGYETVKFKIGGPDFGPELEQLDAVRSAHPTLGIRLDVNGRWTVAEARRRLGELAARIAPRLVEQPVGARELLGLRDAGLPLAADESMRLPGAIEALAEAGSCVAVVLKPMVLGGLQECLRLADAAFDRGLGVIVSHTMGGPIAHAAACELALALATIDPVRARAAAGLGGHEGLPQRDGPWLVAAAVVGHGVDGPS